MATGDTLEGRALSTTGAITVDGVLAYTPIGCGSPILIGPKAPALGTAECYALFSGDGAVSNSGITHVTGDVGTNVGTTTGFNAKYVKGTIHTIPDSSTKQCAADLTTAYNYLDSLKYDIQLLYPAQFGNNLVLTPHTYLLNAATVFTDSLYLNAEGDPDAVFVLKLNGALSTSTYATVILENGAQSKNVYWLVQGAISINNYSIIRGTIICNNGALGALNTGVVLDGRALTTGGALTTTAMTATMTPGCSSAFTGVITEPVNETVCAGNSASFSVTASGAGLKYQWRKGTKDLANGNGISGATSDSLTIKPVTSSDTASDYNVVVTGANGPNDTSINVSLSINAVLAITKNPANASICAGNSAGFSVAATGTGLTYQWRKGTVNLINGTNISGAKSDSLTIKSVSASDTASNYNVIISNVCSSKDTSVNVSLSLNAVLAITKNPDNVSACTGNSIGFSVTATGTGLTYQWRKGAVNLNNGTNISGAKSDMLTINSASASDAASDYNVIISNPCSSKDTSINVSLTINTQPTITAGPKNQTVKAGNSANFSVTATGTGIAYQWKKGKADLSNGGNISGATTAKLTINPVTAADSANDYYVIISGTCTPDSASGNATLSISSTTTGIANDNGNTNNAISIYPNPFTNSITIKINDALLNNEFELIVYNALGTEVVNTIITDQTTTLETGKLPSGIYFYTVASNGKTIQSGKLVSQK